MIKKSNKLKLGSYLSIKHFLITSSKYIMRDGKAAIAYKLMTGVLNKLVSLQVSVGKGENSKKVLNKLGPALINARAQIKFITRFIKKRVKKVPVGALPRHQKRRVFLTFASLIRRSRQKSIPVLASELNLLIKGSTSSALLSARNAQYKKADELKPLIKKGRLPYVPYAKIATPAERKLAKKVWRKSRYVYRYPTFNHELLLRKRMEAYFLKKRTSFADRKIRWRIRQLKVKLFYHPYYRSRFMEYMDILYRFSE